MRIQAKIQIDKESYDFIKRTHKELRYRSLSEYVREAINAKIREDRKTLRENQRAAAMEKLSVAPIESFFESIEGDDFEER